jgi:hypothetical protein
MEVFRSMCKYTMHRQFEFELESRTCNVSSFSSNVLVFQLVETQNPYQL